MQRWSLTVHSPDQSPRTVDTTAGELVVGSLDGPGVLVLSAPGVSPRHARLRLEGGTVRVEALDAEAPVLVKGEVISSPVDVALPAAIRIGEAELRISALEDAGKMSSEEVTVRLVHPAVLYSKPLAYPESPEMTGRIYCSTAEPAAEDGLHEEKVDGAVVEEEKTVAFSFETEDEPVAERMSMAVDYSRQAEIARGGMGKIFSAEDATLGREVALKVSMGRDARQEAQFFREARVLAQLAHPNIVPIHSFGTDSQGRPFYSMKLVRGRTLQAILKQLQAGDAETVAVFTRQRLLDVFRKVCDAVASAHAKGYLHRDLKPENIMVGEYGEVLVMDWGLVKGLPNHPGQLLLDQGQDGEPEVLDYVEGTPQYMSPEQAAGMYGGLDERSDIYSLGGILFAILTLRPPVTGSSVKDVLRKVREGEIGTKSFPAGMLGRETPVAVAKSVPGALMSVALKALSKDRDKRYSSVGALLADIEAYQAGFATVAEEATLLRLMALFVKRHRAASVLAAMLMVAAGLFAVRLAASERRAQHNALRAAQNATIADQNAARAERESRAAVANAELARANARSAQEQARIAEENAARAVAEREAARKATADASIANAEAAEKTLNAVYIRNALEAVPPDLRTQQWEYLNRFLDSSERTIFAKPNSLWKECVPHPKKPGVLVTFEADNWVRFVDLNDGSVTEVLKLDGIFVMGVLALSKDAEKLALISSKPVRPRVYDSNIEIIRLSDGKSLAKIPISNHQNAALDFSNDGRFLMKRHRRGWSPGFEPALYDAETGVARWTADYAGIYGADFAPAASGASKTLVNWASKTHGILQIDPFLGRAEKPAVKFPVPQGMEPFVFEDKIFTHNEDILRRINPADGNILYEFRLPAKLKSVRDVVYLRKYNVIVSLVQIAERSAVLDVRDARSGTAVASFPMVIDGTSGTRDWMLTAHPVSGHVAVFRGNTMKVWTVARAEAAIEDKIETLSGPGFTFFGDSNKVLQVSTERRMIEGKRTQPVEVRQPSGAQLILETELVAERVESNFPVVLSASRDGKTVGALITTGTGFSLKAFHAEGGSLRTPEKGHDIFPSYGFFQTSPDGSQIWGGTASYSAATGKMLWEFVRAGLVEGVRVYGSNQSCWTNNAHVVELCTVQGDAGELQRSLVVWSTSKSKFVHRAPAPHARAVAASPDGTALAEAGADQRVRIRDATTLEVKRVFRVHDAPVVDVAWNPRMPYLATAGEDFRVRIWDLGSGQMLEEIGFLEAVPAQLQWSPDGRTLAVRGQPFKDESDKDQIKRYFFYPKCCVAK